MDNALKILPFKPTRKLKSSDCGASDKNNSLLQVLPCSDDLRRYHSPVIQRPLTVNIGQIPPWSV